MKNPITHSELEAILEQGPYYHPEVSDLILRLAMTLRQAWDELARYTDDEDNT